VGHRHKTVNGTLANTVPALPVAPLGSHIGKGRAMNWDQIEGNWKQFKGRAKQQWGN